MGLSLKGLLKGGLKVGGLLGAVNPLVAVGGGLLIDRLSRKKRRGPAAAQGPTTQTRLTAAVDRAGGQAFGEAGYQGLKDFDASGAYNEYLGGAEEAFGRQLKQGFERVQGTEVGAGRLNSGYGVLDETDFARDLASDYRREASSKALETAGLSLSGKSRLADVEQGRTENYLDILSGQADREQAAANARNERKANRTNAILGTLGTVAGAAAGAYLGRKR